MTPTWLYPSPRWLALQQSSVARLFGHMAALGYHAYLLAADDYEISTALPMGGVPPPPRRLRDARALFDGRGGADRQADVVFSRRDAEFLD